MVLLVYLAAFLVVFFVRGRSLTGGGLSVKNVGGYDYLESVSYQGKRRTNAVPTLGLPLEGSFYFVIGPEKWYHRLLKNMGLASEMQTGDADLDARLFFATDMPDTLAGPAQSESFRNSVRALFGPLGVKTLRAFKGRVWVSCGSIATSSYTQDYIFERLKHVQTVVDGLRAGHGGRTAEEGWLTSPRLAILFMILHAALLTAGIAGMFSIAFESVEMIRWTQLAVLSSIVSFTAAGAWVFLLSALLGSSSWFPLTVADFVLSGIAGIILTSVFAVREANIHFDRSPPVSHLQPVLAKECKLTCSRGSGKRRKSSTHMLTEKECLPSARSRAISEYARTDSKCDSSTRFSYKLTVSPWLPEQKENFTCNVSESVYDVTRQGGTLNIPSHKGALGMAWVDTDEIKPGQK